MNIRKTVDYTEMYILLDDLMEAALPQMDLYCRIGEIVSKRPEKGAAVAAAEYLQGRYPDISGFSPRNLRRMREFYRTYENSLALLDGAMKIGWTQNVVIMESGLALEEMGWYIMAVCTFGWSKLDLAGKIAESAHESVSLEDDSQLKKTEVNIDSRGDNTRKSEHNRYAFVQTFISLQFSIRCAMNCLASYLRYRRRCCMPEILQSFAMVNP